MQLTTRTSDVKAHRSCPRAWYYRAVVDVATRTGQAAGKGTVAHADVERWLQHGTEATTKGGRLLVQGLLRLAELPGLQDVLNAGAAAKKGWPGECEWHWETALNCRGVSVTYHGTADLALWGVDVDGGALVPVIIDHKTRGSMEWALTPDQLAEDWQAAAYAMAVIRKTGAPVIYFVHNNICERDGTIRPVAVRLEAHQVAAVWRQVVAHVESMLGNATAARAEDVPADVTGSACSEYGGCPYRNRCTQWTRLSQCALSARGMFEQPATTVKETPMALMTRPTAPATTATTAAPPSAPTADPCDPPVVHDQVRTDPTTGEIHEGGGYHLYVNCWPLPRMGQHLDVVSLDEVLVPMTAAVCERNKVEHYSLVKFNEGRNQVLAILAINPPPPGTHVLLNTADALQQACLDVLMGKAAKVTWGGNR